MNKLNMTGYKYMTICEKKNRGGVYEMKPFETKNKKKALNK